MGAMNIDLIVRGLSKDDIRKTVSSLDLGKVSSFSETAVSDAIARELSESLSMHDHRFELGGSAFNAARSAALLSFDVRLGFVGVAGSSNASQPHKLELKKLGVETEQVFFSETEPARSISIVSDGDRTLLTSIGSNADAAFYFEKFRAEIAKYLGSFEIVHVTSFLEKDTTKSLANILVDGSMGHDSRPEISVDAGSVWVDDLSEDVRCILSCASILHLNEREFDKLGGRLKNESDEDVASRIFGMMHNRLRRTIVMRRHHEIRIFTCDELSCRGADVQNRVIDNRSVIDPTGAGDTFSGLMLASKASSVVSFALASFLSMAVTRNKISHAGPVTEEDLREGLKQIWTNTFDLGIRTDLGKVDK